MTPEDRILFLCLRQDFLPGHREAVEALCRERRVRWAALAETAERHGVAPVAGENLRRCDPAALAMPAAVAERLELAFFENAVVKEREAERLEAALLRLREAGYEAMLLKGTALDLLVYREPWVVASRDADLVLRPLPGRELAPDEKAVRRALYRSGVECDLLTHHDVTLNGVLPVRFDRVWADARPVRWRGAEALVMSPEDLLVSLCANACRKRFFRLKSLFDIAETVRRLPPGWERFARRSHEHGCGGIVYAALVAARETVGAPVPEEALQGLDVHPGRARLLRALVAGFLRTSSLVGGSDAAGSAVGLARLLPYAGYRWDQAWRSFRVLLTQGPPAHHGAELAESAAFVGGAPPG